MSIIDELLVLFDDEKSRSVEEVKNIYNTHTKQMIASSIGRLVSKKWIDKNQTNDKFKITDKGKQIITTNLSALKQTLSKKLLFHFYVFNIPEKKRIFRDIMRIHLQKNGFGRLHNTVWVSVKDPKDNIIKIINELKIGEFVVSFQASINDQMHKKIISNTDWNYTKLEKDYINYIKNAQQFLLKKNKTKLEARKLIYLLSKIVKSDPILPKKYNLVLNVYQKAYALYLQIRKFSY